MSDLVYGQKQILVGGPKIHEEIKRNRGKLSDNRERKE